MVDVDECGEKALLKGTFHVVISHPDGANDENHLDYEYYQLVIHNSEEHLIRLAVMAKKYE